ncbi:MurR/RpiR family transcriptional regulator [Halobacillus sp. A5]|uniref:MurR/RpiR family transcriptional regulator n=1 Tax=Halobacillus sp. A5 TaxID=2880263 RepID=UPI0020A6252C|nr:MurR/RpiR family transcriptional regulator [Halobacillus sp. A5]MCP3028009.1 MurR/RpiR family transcriptional regulator [Halobacillus sp. A5]
MGILLDTFSTKIPTLTHSEKHVLYYMEHHWEESKAMPLTKMAEENNVSTTTVVRLCHKLGMEGYSELKYFMKNYKADLMPRDLDPIERYKKDVQDSLSQLHPNDLKNIARLIDKSNRIVILSVGLTKMIGEYLSKRLMQMNLSTTYIYESHMIDLISNWIGKDDLVIFISSSGETETLLKAADKLDHLNIETVAMTNDPDSSLFTTCRQSVSAPVEKVSYEGYDVSNRSSLVMLADLTFEYYLKYVSEKD